MRDSLPVTRNTRNDGFTLVEILIALAIFGIVIAQAFAVFGAQHVTYTGTERAIEVQQDVRLVADAVLSDVRMAGYMVPQQAGVGSVDGGNAAADTLCASDPSKILDSQVALASARYDKAEVATAVGAGDAAVEVESLDVDGDGNGDFTVDAGVIIADGVNVHCAVITGVDPTGVNPTILFTPDTPAGFAVAASSGRAVPAVVYQITGSDLRRNGLRLSSQVEDLQIEFGIDANSDGQIVEAEYIDVLNGSDPLDLLAVRVSVITRADREDEQIQSSGRPAAANRTAGAADGFRRRRVTASIVPRNLL